jgi:hypothetical protein
MEALMPKYPKNASLIHMSSFFLFYNSTSLFATRSKTTQSTSMVGVDLGLMIGAPIEVDSSLMARGPTEELVEGTSP